MELDHIFWEEIATHSAFFIIGFTGEQVLVHVHLREKLTAMLALYLL